MRVHELAKKLGLSSKDLQVKLAGLGIEARSHMSNLDEKTVALVMPAAPGAKERVKAVPKVPAVKAPPTVSAEKKPPLPPKQIQPPKEIIEEKVIVLKELLTVGELAKRLKINAAELIKKLIPMGIMATINQRISEETIRLMAKEYGFEVKTTEGKKDLASLKPKAEAGLIQRPPVVTVMGHVDHGKTSLLDAIRQTRVAEREIGGITQHIGAYKLRLPRGEVVFLDTPGHAAFTAMRARGARVTDVVVLVVAADDGIMPQTIEAIDHARAAQVPMVVAINKIDRPNAKPMRVKEELIKYDLTPEELGGKTICVEVSATKRIGIDKLLELLLLEAELLELKADPSLSASGIVIESRLDKGRGPVATVLVQNGTLKVGDGFVAGHTSGKVRAMFNECGENLAEAPPSTPVEILGFLEVPQAGDIFEAVADEKRAKEIALAVKKTEELKPRPFSLGNLYEQIKAGVKEFKIIVKADVHGSVEALSRSLENLSDEKVMIRIIHAFTGDINESDVILASASRAIVIGFNVKVEDSVKEIAEQEGVDIRFYQIIYNALNDVQQAMAGVLEPVYKDVFAGRAEVRQVFDLPNGRQIAGCYVLKGKIVRGAKAYLRRGREKVFEGKISSLRRFKNDAHEVAEGYECGLGLEGFNNYKEDDLIEVFLLEKVA